MSGPQLEARRLSEELEELADNLATEGLAEWGDIAHDAHELIGELAQRLEDVERANERLRARMKESK